MNQESDGDPLSFFEDTRKITRLFGEAVRDALAEHKAAGNTVAVWRDSRVVLVPAEEIDLSAFDPKPRRRNLVSEKPTR